MEEPFNQRKIFHNFPLKQIYKTVHDDYFFSPKEFCILLEEKNIEECFCECYKKDQLAIYDIFASLKLFENFEFQRGGDMFSWYYNKYFETSPDVAFTNPATPDNIVKEITAFEKKVLKEISGAANTLL